MKRVGVIADQPRQVEEGGRVSWRFLSMVSALSFRLARGLGVAIGREV
jgi:hypothetical protein